MLWSFECSVFEIFVFDVNKWVYLLFILLLNFLYVGSVFSLKFLYFLIIVDFNLNLEVLVLYFFFVYEFIIYGLKFLYFNGKLFFLSLFIFIYVFLNICFIFVL